MAKKKSWDSVCLIGNGKIDCLFFFHGLEGQLNFSFAASQKLSSRLELVGACILWLCTWF